MSSSSSSHWAVMATAMAVSGYFIFLTRRQHSIAVAELAKCKSPVSQTTKSCMATGEKKLKNKKRVHFADELVEYAEIPCTDKEIVEEVVLKTGSQSVTSPLCRLLEGLPANRVALYNGILRDSMLRTTYSY